MKLEGKVIAVLVEQHYQDLEVWYPVLRLREEGAQVVIIGTGSHSEYTGKYGYPIRPDLAAEQTSELQFDGLVIPGGWAPDKLRMSQDVLALVRRMDEQQKPIACICHGGWVLVSANLLRGREVTSYIAIKDDMVNAGAIWDDQEVIVDGNMVTSRKPDDLPAFMREFIKLLSTSAAPAERTRKRSHATVH